MARKLETPYLSPPVVMIYKLSTNRAEFHAEEVKVLISVLFAYKTANMRNAFFTNCGTVFIASEFTLGQPVKQSLAANRGVKTVSKARLQASTDRLYNDNRGYSTKQEALLFRYLIKTDLNIEQTKLQQSSSFENNQKCTLTFRCDRVHA